MANVFLSYDHDDLPLARPIAAALEKAGHTVWYDRHIHGGAQYSRKIEQALDSADAVVVLWSPRSLDSAWVRDEAAEGRDRGKLVPLCVEQVTPPMGFRQFQTIELGSWKGRGKVPHLAQLLGAIEAQAASEPSEVAAPTSPPARALTARARWPAILAAGAALLVLLAGGWWLLGRNALPIVEVEAANASPPSQAAASDLYVKLGSLARVGEGRWQLVDSAAEKTPDLLFRTADLSAGGEARANLVLLDGRKNVLLWSREFVFPANAVADLRQQLSLTAGRVLDCALESREAGGLKPDHFKLFLNACAQMAETGLGNPLPVVGMMRTIVSASPQFVPAWRRILLLDTDLFSLAGFGQGDRPAVVRRMKADIAAARKINPDLPEIRYAEMLLLPPTAYGAMFRLLEQAGAAAPGNAEHSSLLSAAHQAVGRMGDGVHSARRAAELDPLSPGLTTALILALAYAGQIDEARKELARAERIWAGTAALRDAQWAFHLRFGDTRVARQFAPQFFGRGLDLYFEARESRSPEAIERFIDHILRSRSEQIDQGAYGGVVQALAEFGRVDQVFDWIARAPTGLVAEDSYLLFRPGLAGVRRDPRFIRVAKRIGLVDFWRSSGRWPDFCSEGDLQYDCKTEAAKYAR